MAPSHQTPSIITNISPFSSRSSSPTSAASSQPTTPHLSPSRSSTTSTRANTLASLHSSPSPRVQLVPHIRTLSFDATFTESERRSLENTSFDARDCASQDFDFEDIFTYDRPPQPKFTSIVEVSVSAASRREVSVRPQFSYSHYGANQAAGGGGKAKYQQQHQNNRSKVAEMYVKNRSEAKRK